MPAWSNGLIIIFYSYFSFFTFFHNSGSEESFKLASLKFKIDLFSALLAILLLLLLFCFCLYSLWTEVCLFHSQNHCVHLFALLLPFCSLLSKLLWHLCHTTYYQGVFRFTENYYDCVYKLLIHILYYCDPSSWDTEAGKSWICGWSLIVERLCLKWKNQICISVLCDNCVYHVNV